MTRAMCTRVESVVWQNGSSGQDRKILEPPPRSARVRPKRHAAVPHRSVPQSGSVRRAGWSSGRTDVERDLVPDVCRRRADQQLVATRVDDVALRLRVVVRQSLDAELDRDMRALAGL